MLKTKLQNLWISLGSLLLLIWGWIPKAMGDDSLFKRMNNLRFAPEKAMIFEAGTLDIRTLAPHVIAHAQGNVWFIAGEFLPPVYWDDSSFQEEILARQAIAVPLNFRTRLWPIAGVKQNYGTFVIRIKNEGKRRLALSFPRLFHAMEVYVVDAHRQERIFSHLKLDKNPANNISRSNLAAPSPAFETDGDLLLFLQVSSPMDKGQNLNNLSSFYLGTEAAVNRMVYMSRAFVILLSGTFLIIFVFYLFIFIFRPEDLSSLYLSLYAFLCLGVSSFYFLPYNLENNRILDLFSTANVWSIAMLQLCLLEKLKFLMSKASLRALMTSSLAIATLASYGTLAHHDLIGSIFYLLSSLSSAALILGTIYLGFKHKLSGIYFFLIGATGTYAFQSYIMSIVLSGANEEFGYGVLLANCSMALGLALVNAREFAEKNKEIVFFNKNLEKMVSQKTSEIRSLLDHIPQGVMSLKAGGIIDKDFSAHLSQILEVDTIAQTSFLSLILRASSISNDQRDQIWQSILATIGEDSLNFDFNSDKLPRELTYHSPSGRQKFLRITWNIEEQDGRVQRLLVTLLDATTEKDLQRESEEQRKELELIQELLNVQTGKASQFFSTSLPLLLENQRILRNVRPLDQAAIRLLFVNAHTVKGSARTLQFKQLAQRIHDMEDVYARILREGAPIEPDLLIKDAEASIQTLQLYLDLNTQKLNRSESFDKVILDREFIESHYYFVQEYLNDRLPRVDIVEWLRSQNEKLTRLIFEQLPAVIDGYRERALKIARDLGKPEPQFEFDVDDVALPPDRKAALDNCMIHLLRNALDHGLESAAERQKAGKPIQGLLRVRGMAKDGHLHIQLSDDGRGLALAVLREKALRFGLIQAHSDLNTIADTVFSPGMSTAQTLSQVSGRGVGMNAVRTFLEKVGGSVHIELGAPKDSEARFYEFTVHIVLPLGPV